MDYLQKAQELKEKLRIAIKFGYTFEGTPKEIKLLAKELKEKIEQEGCGENIVHNLIKRMTKCDGVQSLCEGCKQAIKICGDILG